MLIHVVGAIVVLQASMQLGTIQELVSSTIELRNFISNTTNSTIDHDSILNTLDTIDLKITNLHIDLCMVDRVRSERQVVTSLVIGAVSAIASIITLSGEFLNSYSPLSPSSHQIKQLKMVSPDEALRIELDDREHIASIQQKLFIIEQVQKIRIHLAHTLSLINAFLQPTPYSFLANQIRAKALGIYIKKFKLEPPSDFDYTKITKLFTSLVT